MEINRQREWKIEPCSISNLFLSPDNKYLVGFEDISEKTDEGICLEVCNIWNIPSEQFIGSSILDLEDEV